MKNCSKNVQLATHYYLGCRIALIPEPRFLNKDGSRNVVIRVNYKGKRNYLHIGTIESDNVWDRMLNAHKGEFYNRRMKFLDVFRDTCDIIEDAIDGGGLDISIVKTRITGGKSIYISELAEKYKIGKKFNSVNKIGIATRSFIRCCGDVQVADLSKATIDRWVIRMNADGLSDTTIHIYLSTVKTICLTAVELGYISSSPFKGVKIPKGLKRNDCYLTIEEIRELSSHADDECVRWFIISYLCNGINPVDMASLRYTDHYFRTNGNELEYARSKTEHHGRNPIYIPITPLLKSAMDGYAAQQKLNGLVFPQIWRGATGEVQRAKEVHYFTVRTNKALKKYNHRLSLTWARHSYKTTLMRLGVPEVFTEQMLGHVDNSVAGFYRGGFSPEDRMKYNSMLL